MTAAGRAGSAQGPLCLHGSRLISELTASSLFCLFSQEVKGIICMLRDLLTSASSFGTGKNVVLVFLS